MKNLLLAAGFATLTSGVALAQTTAPADPTTPPAAAPEAPAATETAPAEPAPAAPAGTEPVTPGAAAVAPDTLGVEGGSPIVTLPEVQAGAAQAHFLADDIEGEEVYGARNEEIGEVEDIILSADGTVAAIVIEVGGFLGIGEKDVLVDWNAIEIAVEEDGDLRLLAPTLTREMLEEAEGVDLDTLLVGRD